MELPEEQKVSAETDLILEEDATERDRRDAAVRKAAEEEEMKRRTQVVQKELPLIPTSNIKSLTDAIISMKNPYKKAVAEEMVKLIANDHHPSQKPGMGELSNDAITRARAEIQKEMPLETPYHLSDFEVNHNPAIFPLLNDSIEKLAETTLTLEKKLALHQGGYQKRAKTLKQKITEAADTLESTRLQVEISRTAQIAEESTISSRLERLREEVMVTNKREREAQDQYRKQKEELDSLGIVTNGVH